MSDEFELTAEELQEEQEDAAIRIIQRAYRGKRAIQLLKQLIRANYVKIRDPDFENGFLYKNKATGEVHADKPSFLGEEDLPDPREFKAPYGYDPGPVEDFGCAMLVTVTDYKDPKISSLEAGFKTEHARLENLLTHDFKCRFMDENVISLLNPTAKDFTDGMERLRRMARSTGFIFIYICSHAATVSGKPAGYLCFTDTAWKNADTAKQTALPFTRLCSLVNAIPGSRKTIALSIAHPTTASKRFASSLKLYPPKNFYGDLADICKCAVLGSCNIGTNIREQLMHTSPLPVKEKESAVMRALKRRQRKSVDDAKTGDGEVSSHSGEDSSSSDDDQSEEDFRRIVRATGPIRYRKYKNHEYCPEVVQDHLQLLKKRKKERMVRDGVAIAEPRPAWQRSVEHDFIVVTPSLKEHRRYQWAKKWERLVKSTRPVLDKWSDSSLENNWLTKDTPKQHSYADASGSAFMVAVMSALDGGIDYSKEVVEEYGNASLGTVTVSEVFKHTRTAMKHFFTRLNAIKRRDVEDQQSHASANIAAAEKDSKRKGDNKTSTGESKEINEVGEVGANADGGKNEEKKIKKKKKKQAEVVAQPVITFKELPPQYPVLFLPAGFDRSEAVLSNPVCFRPSAPPPPDKPFAIKVGSTFVLLEWEQALFDGVMVDRYDMYMKNETRLYKDWKLAPNASTIKAGGLYTRFTVNHLPIGIRTEFRVVGYNSVGRSLPSKASVRVTPGENLVPVGSEHRWRRLAHGGSMAVLDHMEHYLIYRNEILRGFRLMIAFAQKTQGFARLSTQVRACKISVAVIEQYPHDVSCLSGAMLLLGYSSQGASRSKDTRAALAIYALVEESNLAFTIKRYLLEFESFPHFRQAIYWCISSGVPLPGVSLSSHVVRDSTDRNTDALFNIFKLRSEEDGDESITEETVLHDGYGPEEDEVFSGSNPMNL